jgi:plastocyanin
MIGKLVVIVGVVLVIVGVLSWTGTETPKDVVVTLTPTTTPSSTSIVPTLPKAPTVPSVAVPTQPATPTGAGARTFENGFYVTTIYLTNTGFVPSSVEVNKGEEVRFVDRANGIMYIVADDKASSVYYRAIKQPALAERSSTFQFGVPEAGTFSYYNLNSNPRFSGTIIVK